MAKFEIGGKNSRLLNFKTVFGKMSKQVKNLLEVKMKNYG